MASIKPKAAPQVPFLEEFKELSWLWEGTKPLYPSEHSARWGVKKLRDKLIAARAVAMHRGRYLVHPERFTKVAEEAAIEAFSSHA